MSEIDFMQRAFDEAAETYQRGELMEGISTERVEELASAEREGKIRIGCDWTPCADGKNLPKDGVVVLVTGAHSRLYDGDNEYPDTVFEAYHEDGVWKNNIGLRMTKTQIIAWMPKPAHYNPDHIRDTTKKVKEDAE